MKRTLLYAAVSAFTLFAFAACSTEPEFNKEFMYGEWESNQTIAGESQEIHDLYNRNGTGSTWSVTEDTDPQYFKWNLSGGTLQIVHCTEMSGGQCGIPKDYTMMELTASTLRYKDYTGKVISCTKVN